jgi:hypothetical protein
MMVVAHETKARGRARVGGERFVTEQAWADVYNGDDWRTRECMPMLLPPRASVPQARNASGSAPYDQSDSVIFVAVPRPSAHHTSAVSTQRDGCSFINMSFTSESPIPKISKYTSYVCVYVELEARTECRPANTAARRRWRPGRGRGRARARADGAGIALNRSWSCVPRALRCTQDSGLTLDSRCPGWASSSGNTTS